MPAMRGILRKDVFVLWKFSAVTVAFCAVMSLLAGNAAGVLNTGAWLLSYFPVIFAVNAVAVDEGRWDRFAAVMPLRPREIVLGKYMLAWGNLA